LDPKVWPEPGELLVCLDSVEREASPDCQDLLESQASRELLEALETEDPLDLWDPLG